MRALLAPSTYTIFGLFLSYAVLMMWRRRRTERRINRGLRVYATRVSTFA
jgi:hypothetical protein